MIPVLRVILPSANIPGEENHGVVTRGANADYITDDPTEDKPIPPQALYAARMNSRGQVTVVRSRHVSLTPDHTYSGWPVPA